MAALALAAVVAGCGGSHQSDTAAIRAALVASPKTYLHYGARTWGVHPHVHVRITIDGDRATAVLSAPRATRQRIGFRNRGGMWHIATAEPGVLNGPRAERLSTRSELAAISAAGRRGYPAAGSCITYAANISKLDPRYARVDFVFPKSALTNASDRCAKFVGNGEEVFRRSSSGWHYVGGESDGFPCGYLPPGVARSLFGSCWTFK